MAPSFACEMCWLGMVSRGQGEGEQEERHGVDWPLTSVALDGPKARDKATRPSRLRHSERATSWPLAELSYAVVAAKSRP